MSELSYAPPPPPPPAQPARAPEFDFARPFVFVFEDPNWVTKILIGGLFYLAAVFIVGLFFVFGYNARLARNVINGVERPLPEWEDLGDLFVEGVKMFVIALLYFLPLIGIAILAGVPAILAGAMHDEGLEALGGGLSGCIMCLVFPLAVATACWLPAALLRAVHTGRLGSAFEIGAIWDFIRANPVPYLLAIAVYLVARLLGGLGIILFCIGVIFTAFWSLLVMTHGFAQAYRLRRNP